MTTGRARSVCIVAPGGGTGKSLVALGVVDLLARRVGRVGVFRPVTRSTTADDPLLDLLLEPDRADLSSDRCHGVTYDEVHADPEAALGTIVERYRDVERDHDAVVIVGSDYTEVPNPTELRFNARVATNVGAPVLLVVSALGQSPDAVVQMVEIADAELRQEHARAVGVVANRCDPDRLDAVRARLSRLDLPTWALPEVPLLTAPLVSAVMDALGGELVGGNEDAGATLHREAEHMLVCGMNVEHVLARLQDGQLCIAAGDRPDVLVALAAAHAAEGHPTLTGVVLNGGYGPGDGVLQLVRALADRLPLILTPHDSYDAARIVASTRGTLATGTQRKIDTALRVFEDHIDPETLLPLLDVPPSTVVTPLMFELMLLERARADRRHVVLAEGDEERVLRAAATLLSRQVVDLTLLGSESQIRAKASSLGLDITGAHVIDPRSSDLIGGFAEEYTRLRAHRGMTLERAVDIVGDVSYFATMMVHVGLADGMVSGAVHSTAHTITPSFEIIKTTPGTAVVSSIFFMCLEDRVLVFGDCAVLPEPNVEQLADIAVSAADTAAQFGIEPRVAMLSYSTGTSGSGSEVDKVRAATQLVRARRPDLPVDGPIQYDAAIDATVAATKMPESEVAGRATVFVFPDLNTGNNTYKAVQRSTGTVAVGPILQGLNRPVNDLSRGASVRDIVNTIAITAIQAQTDRPAAGAPAGHPSP